MRNNAFIQLQTLRLAQSGPIHLGAWTSCSKGKSLSPTTERCWTELRGDVMLLYPGSQIVHEFHMHRLRRGINRDPSEIQTTLEEKQEVMKQYSYYSYVNSFSSKVPTKKIVPVLFRICQKEADFAARTITFTGYNASAIFPQKSMTLLFDTYEAMMTWQNEVFKVPEVYQKTLSDFIPVRHVGKGATSDVFLVRDRFSRKTMAMKAIDKGAFPHHDSLRRIIDERIVHFRMRKHPYILEMSHAFETKEKLYVGSEYCSRGDLFRYLRDSSGSRTSEETAKTVAAEVLLALEALHDQGIWYRDLKPENIMVADDGHVKLGDFGAAKITNPKRSIPRSNSSIGTVEYLAPEMVRAKPHNRMVDLWAFGILVCELLNGETPFEGDTETMTYENIKRSPLPLPVTMPAEPRDLVRRLLRRDPSQRLGSGVNGWADVKAHPWFKDVNWEMLLLRPASRGPFGSYTDEMNRPPTKRRFMEDDQGCGEQAAEERKRRALENYMGDLMHDLEHTTAARAAKGRESNVPLQDMQRMKRTFGAYGCGEKRMKPLPLKSEAPLRQLHQRLQSESTSRASMERSESGFWRKFSSLCSRVKFWRRR